ncbi:ParB/RepB/Spo0J family partition protein [Butyrivibrio sp.]|uniref:ParB/RepB/Spo0J family partition protein n=1 Tax=Butyrivibrio sp. TaxID=28121 RepID=UPI0025C40498|nr:ParB/RepB/Spo0J family partition protein [Butyrivibrio sp.]MBQ9304298.1 ParB/RepB/Spo0J family partition protein [Butyrivibrio sp.]
MAAKRQKIHFESVEELLGAPITKDVTEEIQISQIRPFKDHPFKVIDDSRMEDLVKSIAVNGVLTPVMLRPSADGGYEMVSGHRRMHAAKLAGLKTIPAVVKEMDDDTAVVAMVDSNVQREEILPSERAFAFKMKFDVLKRQGKRNDLSSGTEFPMSDEEDDIYEDELSSGTEFPKSDTNTKEALRARTVVGKEAGISGRQVQKYICLTELIPDLLDLVDAKKIGLNTAVDIAHFDRELQNWIYEYYSETGFLRPVQIEALKNTENVENISHTVMTQIMRDALPENKPSRKVSLSEKKLDKYFPPHFSAKEREMVILGLLEKWQQENEQ